MERFLKIFMSIPSERKKGFGEDCIKKNLSRFSRLPIFNIITQISCIFIYLYVYPTIYPEKPTLNFAFYIIFSSVYIILNTTAFFALNYLKRHPGGSRHYRYSSRAIDLFLIGYTLLESIQVLFELSISGNLYRFLATFVVVSFMPVISRRKRFLNMTLYLLVSEGSLLYMLYVQNIPMYSYREIIFVFYCACLLAANIMYSSTIRNYILHISLIESNEKLKQLNELLENLSTTDALTGVSNRRALDTYAENSWNSALRANSEISVIMIDIDYFKKYNDTYGHQAGDDCLVQVARRISNHFHRSIDMVARYGGEEFIVWLPHVTLESCQHIGEKLRKSIEKLAIPHSKNPPTGVVTISVGIATLTPSLGESYELLIRHADNALYTAKGNGRNQIYVSTE